MTIVQMKFALIQKSFHFTIRFSVINNVSTYNVIINYNIL